MQDMKNYLDKKFNKQAKQTEKMKSGFESALNKETEQYRERIFALENSFGETDKTLYLLYNKMPSPEIQNISNDEKLSWLRIQTSSSSKVTFSDSTVISAPNSNYKIGVTMITKEKLSAKLKN